MWDQPAARVEEGLEGPSLSSLVWIFLSKGSHGQAQQQAGPGDVG